MNKFQDTVFVVGILTIVVAIIILTVKTIPYTLLPLGAIIWYCWFKLECAINGGVGFGISIFEYAKDDFKNNFGSNQQQNRLKLSNGDEEWAEMFPGKFHCIFTHIFIPLAPLLIWGAISLK